MVIPRGSDAPLTVYLQDRDGGEFTPSSSSFTRLRLTVSETAGGSAVIDRSTDAANLSEATVGGISALQGDAVSAGEWAGIPAGVYVAQVWFGTVGGEWFASEYFRVRVTSPVGGPLP